LVSIKAIASDLIEAAGTGEAPRVARRAARDVLTRRLSDEPLRKNRPDIVHEVALEYRRVCRVATAAGATGADCEGAAVNVAIQRYEELGPTAPFNRYDAVAATLEMVGKVNSRTTFGSGTALTPDASRSETVPLTSHLMQRCRLIRPKTWHAG
jgi:hypothetical protein